jgi:hypothetical protein
MWAYLLILLLVFPMEVAVVYILGHFFLQQAKGPLARLREPQVRRDFVFLMLASGIYIAGVAYLLDKYLPGA